MDAGAESPAAAPLAELLEELALRELGYRLTYREAPGGWVTVAFGHALLLQDEWMLTTNIDKPGWDDWIREQIVSSSDVALVRQAGVLRPESVPIVAALRHGAHMGRLRHHQSADAADAALLAVSSATRSLLAASVLTQEEADWLLRALEADQDR